MRGEPAPYSREHFLLREEAPAYEEDDDRERETLLGGGNGGGSAAMEQMQQIGGASSGYMERTCALLGPPLFLWVFFYAGCNVGPDLLSYFIICLVFLAASVAACFMERGEQAVAAAAGAFVACSVIGCVSFYVGTRVPGSYRGG